MKRRSLALACASLAAGLTLGSALPAHAAPGVAPTLINAYTTESPGDRVAVAAQSDSAITAITVHLFRRDAGEGAPEVAAVADFQLTSGSEQYGTWVSSQPLHLTDLGVYRIVVDLTDADGDHAETESLSSFVYAPTANVEDFTVTPDHPDYAHPVVTVSGRYTLTDPRTGQTAPAAGRTVSINTPESAALTAVTDGDGRFSASFTPTFAYSGQIGSWLASDDPLWQNGSSASVTPVRSDTRVQLDATDLSAKQGEAVTVSGLAQVLVDGVWQPLPGATVDALWDSDSGAAATRPVSGPDGHFAGKLTMPRSGTVEVGVRGFPDAGPFLNASPHQHLTVHIARKTSIPDFTASLDKYARLTASGHLNTGSSYPASSKVTVEYSADGKTGWKTATTLDVGRGDAQGTQFKGTFDAPAKGYWRAHYAGTADWQPAYSAVVYAKRTPTRITGANASPEPVKKGKTITVTGKLQKSTSGGWKAYASQKVHILFRAKGTSTWYDMGTATSTSSGSFSKKFTASKDGTWVPVLLYPASGYLVSAGYEDYVDVT
jgi:hypothetical protein